MKVLLLSPAFYTLDKTIELGITRLGHSVYKHDYRQYNHKWKKQLNAQMYRFPFAFRDRWENYFMQDINSLHLEIFEREKPDLVFIYNNEMLLPETLNYFKKNGSKVLFIMGDNPFYTPTNNYYLALLREADLIISPDTFWMEQLNCIGIKNVIFDFPGYNDELFSSSTNTDNMSEYKSPEVLFVGTGYTDSWGYKRALFISRFAGFDLKVYGTKHWIKWMKFFPELKSKFTLLEHRLPFEDLKKLMSSAKLYPVDANPGVLNGIHLRIFETIACGVLPLAEYRFDVERVFGKVGIPLIKDYNKAASIASHYLKKDSFRYNIIKELQEFIQKQYSPEVVINRILSSL